MFKSIFKFLFKLIPVFFKDKTVIFKVAKIVDQVKILEQDLNEGSKDLSAGLSEKLEDK